MNKIIYIFDPLCGWCYGFGAVVKTLEEKYRNEYSFDVVSGGMVTGARVGPIAQMEEYIKGAYKRVEEMTQVTFGLPYLEKLLPSTDVIMDSKPPSYALEAMRILKPEATFSFAHALQIAHYQFGQDYNQESTYRKLALAYGVVPDEFIQTYQTEEVHYAAEQNFAWCANIGVQGYPTLLMEKGEQLFLLAQGFRPLEEIVTVMQSVEAES